MARFHLWGVATILANTFFRECTHDKPASVSPLPPPIFFGVLQKWLCTASGKFACPAPAITEVFSSEITNK